MSLSGSFPEVFCQETVCVQISLLGSYIGPGRGPEVNKFSYTSRVFV